MVTAVHAVNIVLSPSVRDGEITSKGAATQTVAISSKGAADSENHPTNNVSSGLVWLEQGVGFQDELFLANCFSGSSDRIMKKNRRELTREDSAVPFWR